MMKAIVMKDYGGPEVFEEQDIAVPSLKDNQVLVDMYATTASSADQLIRSGAFRQLSPLQFPYIPGVEFAGVVKEVGEKVTRVQAGDRVMGLVRTGGGYAEQIAVDESALAIIPASLSFAEAAAIPASALTAWQSLFQYGELQPGQRILIHAGAGSVGHLAVQLAKQHGAYVITTARENSHEFLRQLGADEVIDYTTSDFAEGLSPVDIVLDMVRDETVDKITGIGETERKNYTLLKDGGKLISLVNSSIAKHEKLRGIDAQFAYIVPNPHDLEAIVHSIQEHKLRVHMDEIFPFSAEGVTAAHHYMETKGKRGKIVIQWKLI
jgi:NADPH:quinone reductase-like Zn-dependent oxidoreductase